jgi:hypothetical protein
MAPPLPDLNAIEAKTPTPSPSPTPEPPKPRPRVKESPYKLSNFLLGFAGGAVLGGAYGILSDNSGKEGVRNAMGAIYAAIGGAGFGTVALLLGATTPPEAAPPQVEGKWRYTPGVQLSLNF